MLKFHLSVAYFSLHSVSASSRSYVVSLPVASWMLNAFLKPVMSALLAVSGETACPSVSWMEVIFLFATVATCMQFVAHGTRNTVNISVKLTFSSSVPCWRTVPLRMVCALPLIFLPLTVRFGQFFVSPVL